jgi:hypothetical protein
MRGSLVIPAKAGIHAVPERVAGLVWTPAFAGVTAKESMARVTVP